ncbi:MAG: divalent-cation tolerance protein CutA [Flavobacteriales bacterium]
MAYWVYITTRDEQEAEKVGSSLIKGKLAACVNIIPGMRSMFWWEGKVDSDNETILIAKTKASLIDQVTEHVKSVHSDDCPCVIALPIENGNPDFLKWIDEETKEG